MLYNCAATHHLGPPGSSMCNTLAHCLALESCRDARPPPRSGPSCQAKRARPTPVVGSMTCGGPSRLLQK
eukprot:15017210-Alexandrium_andersonii.AAC.1